MIAATIGQTFLNAWNTKNNKEYSSKEFFDKEFFRLFYDHPKYMQWITNSPFVQGLSSSIKGNYGISEVVKDDKGNTLKFNSKEELGEYIKTKIEVRPDFLEIIKKSTSTKGIKFLKTLNSQERNILKEKFYEKVNNFNGKKYDGSIAIGFPAAEDNEFATTSGLVSDIEIPFSEAEVYLSWIGNGLSVGVDKGYTILFSSSEILLYIYEGWELYRRFLNDSTIKLTGKQISTWNGQWLNYRLSFDYNDKADFNTLSSDISFFNVDNGKVSVLTVKWPRLFFNLSQKFKNDSMLAYIFSIGKMNKTIGFLPFFLSQGKSYIKVYSDLFGQSEFLNDKRRCEELFDNKFDIACKYGAIGLQALEPKGLREFFGNVKMPNFKFTPVVKKAEETDNSFEEQILKTKQKDYKNTILFRTYKTWLLAMITKNKQEDLHYSEEVAKALKKFRANASKRDRINLIENELLKSKFKKQFLDGLAKLIKEVEPESIETFKNLRDKIHFMSTEDFGYFVVLLKFDYAYQERNL